MDFDIEGDRALVTASSRGLGRASAAALVENGANVVVNGRDEERLEETAADLRERAVGDADVIPVVADLTDADDVERLVETAVDELGGLDHLVTSAGGPPSGPFLETDDEDWYEAYDLLVMSVVRAVRHAADALKADGGGTVTCITSGSVKEAIPSLVLSNAVRMSVVGLEKTLSEELAPEVRANTVLPGAHETSRIQDLIEQRVERGEYEDYEAGLAERGESNPMNRIGQPEELGETVAFLCSPHASFINGVAIPIDGGDHAANL